VPPSPAQPATPNPLHYPSKELPIPATHYTILNAAKVTYLGTAETVDELMAAQRVLKEARGRGYKFDAWGTCLNSVEWMAQAVAADQIWEALTQYCRTPDFVPGRPY